MEAAQHSRCHRLCTIHDLEKRSPREEGLTQKTRTMLVRYQL